MRVLIVDDSAVNREFLLGLVEEFGECVAVDSGEKALARFLEADAAGRPFALVFLDIMLPGIDGLATLERMRAIERERRSPRPVKVVVTTGLDNGRKAGLERLRDQAVAYLVKPFTPETVLAELKGFGLI
jgi:two-component system chemotaxis response regulator CheY